MRTLKVLVEGLAFPEGPRWRDGKLFFSDMHANQVCTVDLAGKKSVVCEVPQRPSGLGWLPDGRMLVVSMTDRKLLRLEPGGLKPHADMSQLAPFDCNDMVVDAKGRAYVGNFGFDLHKNEKPRTTTMVMVTPDGQARIAADDLSFPNGTVITPDGKTLVVGESMGRRLTAFDIAADGTLSNRRVWAQLGTYIPDGIGLDAEGAIWVACPSASEVVRVKEGGEIAERIKVGADAFACILGGADGKTLFVATAANSDPEKCKRDRTGKIEITQVEVGHAGLP
ncbi:MAG: SMP-30/gluconolactonase/LRE family protein [Candidatus Binatus sp.]|uniref:SMP-30/gluconolactonase/LRE family protein n=1 Tax=Candidatus Binatus sp. TaxID=2811406 RepID=UPI0027278B06|nr:SMP-30/gluconolactonase/LRE family protein [Candidatus Binatus sp.]MDO8434803.1 SMP-30/gluconolactonase/LRE family protein [Candidatus Binatus sp.]